jgi:sulfofructose kinase
MPYFNNNKITTAGESMDIVGIGRPCIDMISVIEELPKPNHGSRVLDSSTQGGGVVPTAMVAASRLGAKVGFIGVSGGCRNGALIRKDFIYNGVDISHSVIDEEGISDFAIVLSDLKTHGRSILYKPGTARRIKPEDLNRDYIERANFLHLASYDEASRLAAAWMREAGKKVVYDASGYTEELESFIPQIDVFIASEFYYNKAFEGRGTYEENCLKVLEMGPEVVVFTLGEKGCVGMSREGGFFMAEGYRTPVVDTVGAGDVYHGAFLFGLTKGWDIPYIAQFSNAVSAIKIGAIGGRAGIPSYETTLKFMETGEIDDREIKERVEHYRRWSLYDI